MFRSTIAATALALGVLAVLASPGPWQDAGLAGAASQSGSGIAKRPLLDANRADCEAIRGTDYLSDEERAWFLAYCVGVIVYAPVVVANPVPDVFLLPPVAQRASEPGVSVTCRSSLGSATAAGDLQNVPLSAIAGELIYCSASVSGSYTSIDWAGGFTNGSGVNFATSFDYRRTPWTIRVQVNWGGNPVSKYVSVTTFGIGCLPQPGYVACIP